MSASRSSPLSGCQLPLQDSSGAGDQLRRHQCPVGRGLPPLLCCVPGEWVTSTSRIPHTPFQAGRATRLPQVTTPVSPPGLPGLCGGARQPDARTPRSLCSAAAVPAGQLNELAALADSSQLSTPHEPGLAPAALSHAPPAREGTGLWTQQPFLCSHWPSCAGIHRVSWEQQLCFQHVSLHRSTRAVLHSVCLQAAPFHTSPSCTVISHHRGPPPGCPCLPVQKAQPSTSHQEIPSAANGSSSRHPGMLPGLLLLWPLPAAPQSPSVLQGSHMSGVTVPSREFRVR